MCACTCVNRYFARDSGTRAVREAYLKASGFPTRYVTVLLSPNIFYTES